jgi:hypothetical protein|tara:strand:+ start:143 stop:613 length:471 start_codon:yes stop_codon:yes gene_type:complete
MAKVRKIASIEKGIEEVVKILNEEEIQQAIGKSVSYLRKCSDPDLPQQIDHNDSFRLDKACIEKDKAPPLLTAHEYMIAQEFDKLDSDKTKNINDMLVKFTILHGKLAELIIKAHNPESDKGPEISPLEKKEINEAITALENKILKLKKAIDIKKS